MGYSVDRKKPTAVDDGIIRSFTDPVAD